MMTFDKYWSEVAKLEVLPTVAIIQLPSTLSDSTKRLMMRRSPEETAVLLLKIIDLVNNGSVESIDSLVKKRL